jgi:hypothetical protein
MRCRRSELSGSIDPYRGAADTDVVAMDQLGLLISVGIAVAAGAGSHGRTIFVKRAKSRFPYCAPTVLGHASKDSMRQTINFKGLIVDAQGIEPWTSPV